MAVLKCKMCGGDLNITEGRTTVECEYCGSVQTVPSADNEKKLNLFSRANRLRIACEFDKAAGVFESIVAEFPEESEAYWGLVLCKYGIEYVDDPATGKKIPTCHRSSFDSVMDDNNFDLAMENADEEARKLYLSEAKVIEEIRKGIVQISSSEEPYDIFICYKETDSNGKRTLDSVIAQDVYTRLTEKGYRVFFSRITLKEKLGQEYEPYIFAALNSAKIMLVFGTCYDHFHAVWVKNEWSRFLELMKKDSSKRLFPCYRDIDPYDMPKEFMGLQGQNMAEIGADQDILMGIEKLIGKKSNEKNKAEVKKAETVKEVPASKPIEQTRSETVSVQDSFAGMREKAEKNKEKINKINSFNNVVLIITLILELAVFVIACMELSHMIDIGLYETFTNTYVMDQLMMGAPALGLVLLPAIVSFVQAAKNPKLSKTMAILARVIGFLGMLIFFGVVYLISSESPNAEEYIWFIWNGLLHLVPFITLFFKKKGN